MRTDSEIQKDIVQEFKWDPRLRDSDIAVGVRDGVVTLGGVTRGYTNKVAAERAASRIKGVKAIANEIEVKLLTAWERSDPDLARATVEALTWHASIPQDHIRISVERGWVRLEGEVDWHYQKEEAERAVRVLTGVKGVSNQITVKAQTAPADVKSKIKQALHRAAELDANHVLVEVDGNKAILSGTVRAFAEKLDAERAARNAPGITTIDNRLIVDPYAVAVV